MRLGLLKCYVKCIYFCSGPLVVLEPFLKTVSLIQTHYLWVTVSQVAKFGPRVSGWGCGTQGRRERESRTCRSYSCRQSAPRAQPLHAPERKGTIFSNFKAPNGSVVGYRQYCDHQHNRLSAEAFPSADVSMNFSGKLPNVLLLVLLAAQGKHSDPQRAVDRCWALKKYHCPLVTLVSPCLGHVSVLLSCSLHHFQMICSHPQPSWALVTVLFWMKDRIKQSST